MERSWGVCKGAQGLDVQGVPLQTAELEGMVGTGVSVQLGSSGMEGRGGD